jgi:PTH1 family peptidyl-tRNA hydrolase
LIVLHDELDLPFGTVRIKQGGGDNGHNGLRSITRSVSSPDYVRVRIGIGRPMGRQSPADFVLHDFSAAERTELPAILDQAARAVSLLIAAGVDRAQNELHRP